MKISDLFKRNKKTQDIKYENQIVYYNDIMSEEDIVKVGFNINEFINNKIVYKELSSRLSECGYKLEPVLKEKNVMRTISMAEEFSKRKETGTLVSNDILNYILVNKDNIKISFVIDYNCIKTIANYGKMGNVEFQEKLENIENWQNSHINSADLRKIR